MTSDARRLAAEISDCTICSAHLQAGPRPVVQFSASSGILVIGQAPGSKVHASGIPWSDDSGLRLRAWMGIDDAVFYDPLKIALMPMGFCYPGKGRSGDLPPRPECAPRWHDLILSQLPADRLTLLVGTYAQSRYLAGVDKRSLTERVRGFQDYGDGIVPLPHPSWRSTLFQRRNPWFERELLPVLRSRVADRLRREHRPGGG